MTEEAEGDDEDRLILPECKQEIECLGLDKARALPEVPAGHGQASPPPRKNR